MASPVDPFGYGPLVNYNPQPVFNPLDPTGVYTTDPRGPYLPASATGPDLAPISMRSDPNAVATGQLWDPYTQGNRAPLGKLLSSPPIAGVPPQGNSTMPNSGLLPNIPQPQTQDPNQPPQSQWQQNGGWGAGNPLWMMLMGLGAGLGEGSGKGVGPGIGMGINYAMKMLEMQRQFGLRSSELALKTSEVVTLPDGSQAVYNKLNQTLMPFNSSQGGTQEAATPAPSPTATPVADQSATPVASPGAAPAASEGPMMSADGKQTLQQAVNVPAPPNPMRGSAIGVGEIAATGQDTLKTAAAGRENAIKANAHLGTLSGALDKIPTQGPLSAGPLEEGAADFAGKVNDLARRAYLPTPFNQDDVANLELASKEAKLAGLTQGRANFGASREGQQTVQLLQKTVPNPTMSSLGRRQIVAQQRALNQRDIDYSDFLTAWMQSPVHKGDPTGASQAFDNFRPPQYYADMAAKEMSQYDASGRSNERAAQDRAKDAIARGADPKQVIQRLQKAGFSTAGM